MGEIGKVVFSLEANMPSALFYHLRHLVLTLSARHRCRSKLLTTSREPLFKILLLQVLSDIVRVRYFTIPERKARHEIKYQEKT